MFRKQALRKNKYLHTWMKNSFHYTSPVELNRCVENDFKSRNQEHVEHSVAKFNVNEFQTAYGLRALPKILGQILQNDPHVQLMGLCVLAHLLKNPLEYNRAINDFNVGKRLERILLNQLLSSNNENLIILEYIFRNLEILSENYNGAACIYRRKDIICALFGLLTDDNKEYRNLPVVKILYKMAFFPVIAESMIDDDHHKMLFEIFECLEFQRSTHTKDLFILLSYLIMKCPQELYNEGYYCIIINKIKVNADPLNESSYDFTLGPIIWKCFAHLLSVKEASLRFVERENGIQYLFKLIQLELLQSNVEMLENIVLTLQHCTIHEIALHQCEDCFQDLPLKLIEKARYKEDNLQLYCLQTLRQISVVPSIKNYLKEFHTKHIECIPTMSNVTKDRKRKLLDWLNKKNYKNTELHKTDTSKIKTKKDKKNIDDQINIHKPKEIAYRLDYGTNTFIDSHQPNNSDDAAEDIVNYELKKFSNRLVLNTK